LIKGESHNVVIRTGMNLNANATCETFEIDESKRIYAFYSEFIDNLKIHMPEGFEKSSKVANKVLKKLFLEKQKDNCDISSLLKKHSDYNF